MGGHTGGRAPYGTGYLLLLSLVVTSIAGCNDSGNSTSTTSSASTLNLSGSPATVVQVGQQYSFTPTVKSADAVSIGFSVSNKPAWATFNTASGKLTGTPTGSDVGTDANIAITANSGSSDASLPTFTITVTQAGTVVLNWQEPTTNTDGSPLTDLAGYTINYGTISSLLTQSASVDSPTTTSYSLPNLAAGTWYFALSANNSAGVQGALSEVISAAVP